MRETYTEDQVVKALTTLAYFAGNARKASEQLASEGLQVKPETLKWWKYRSRAEQYARICSDVAPRIQAMIAERHQSLEAANAEVESEALGQLLPKIRGGELSARDLTAIARNAAASGGVHTQHHQLLMGNPTQRVDHDIKGLLRALKARGLEIEGSIASEETIEPPALDAEVVDED